MIISANSIPKQEEFNLLIERTLSELNNHAKKFSKSISLLSGNKLEPFVKDILSEQAMGTDFENSIELISGQKFPDIIAKKYYGIEVKSTTQNHWKTTGNSVLESTRVEGIERIYMLFGKLMAPIEFRCRPYEECLSEVVVTHSPRYLIDMNLLSGHTIFDKMNVSYDNLRNKENPLKPVVDYYKKKLKPGEDVWWIGQEENGKSSSIIIKIWNNLTAEEKHELKVKAMVFFPELFSNNQDKFGRLAVWLITRESVVCPNIRDLFTAGGKSNIMIGRIEYKNVPRIFVTLIKYLPSIYEKITKTHPVELSEHWQVKTTEKNKIGHWINLVTNEAKKITESSHINISEMINKSLNLISQ